MTKIKFQIENSVSDAEDSGSDSDSNAENSVLVLDLKGVDSNYQISYRHQFLHKFKTIHWIINIYHFLQSLSSISYHFFCTSQ